MKNIKHHSQLLFEKQRLRERRIRLEEKMQHDWQRMQHSVSKYTTPLTTAYQVVNGKWIKLLRNNVLNLFNKRSS